MDQIELRLEDSCSSAQLKKLQEEIGGCARVGSMLNLRREVVPKVEGFQKMLDDFRSENENMRMCVR